MKRKYIAPYTEEVTLNLVDHMLTDNGMGFTDSRQTTPGDTDAKRNNGWQDEDYWDEKATEDWPQWKNNLWDD